jgi:hypothetical protein
VQLFAEQDELGAGVGALERTQSRQRKDQVAKRVCPQNRDSLDARYKALH